MKELKNFEDTVMSLEGITAQILSSEKGFITMPKLLREDLADRIQRVRLYLLFSRGNGNGNAGSNRADHTLHSKSSNHKLGDPCPVCGTTTQRQGGCSTCPGCGWSKCS